MATIQEYIHVQDQWSLDELVRIANELLPQHLPQEDSKNRVLEEVNPRLVRHYTSCKLIDRPVRIGREGRYGYRHLVQLLVVRRLLMEGYTAGAIYKLVYRMSTPELQALLEQGVHLQLNPPPINPALAFLQQVQDRSEHRHSEQARANELRRTPEGSLSSSPRPETWNRVEIMPGFEVHIREDFDFPQINRDQEALVKQLVQLLCACTQR